MRCKAFVVYQTHLSNIFEVDQCNINSDQQVVRKTNTFDKETEIIYEHYHIVRYECKLTIACKLELI